MMEAIGTSHPARSKPETVIVVENVCKRFTIGPGGSDLRERFRNVLPGRKSGEAQEFWALRDVSFSVEPGKTLGIIGHNGSGKSTLLKMLTGILKPTSGRVTMQGRVGALIEVGAGFHPDFTGRENIFLNGSILGLSRRDIAARFDQIVAFAGLEKFIDTPVKRYSSGMYMRLGFSIAAHTDPKILLVDEVLAVGDALFQAKCIRHLKQFVSNGGTVVFVSHAMAQVAEVCQTCLWLDHGRMRFHGPTEEAIEQYQQMVAEREEEEFKRLYPVEWQVQESEKIEKERRKQEEAQRVMAGKTSIEDLTTQREAEKQRQQEAHLRRLADPCAACVLDLKVTDEHGYPRETFVAGTPLIACIRYRWGRTLNRPIIGLEIFHAETEQHLFSTSNFDHDLALNPEPHTGCVSLRIPFLSLNEGRYRLRISVYPDSTRPQWHLHPEDNIDEAAFLEVRAGRFAHGLVYLPVEWSVRETLVTDETEPSHLRMRQDSADKVPVRERVTP